MKQPQTILARSISRVALPALLSASVLAGCAHQSGEQAAPLATQETAEQLRARLDEVERTNGRLNVRIEELEDQVFLLQDMTESNRIALQRRGYMGQRPYAQAQPPQPAPESYYGSQNPYGAQPQQGYEPQPTYRRPVVRIPLSKSQGQPQGYVRPQPAPQQQAAPQPQAEAPAEPAEEAEIVITEEEFRAFAGEPQPSRTSGGSSSSAKRAQPPVTDEKLATSQGGADDAPADSEPASRKAKPRSSGNIKPLELYKTALAQYRGGEYGEALAGFEAFLAAEPRVDYVDNALYWIGECHYGLGDYDQAVGYFQRVMRDQPDGNKVPDAMLKMSLAYERMGRPDEARTLLEKLTSRFPTTNAGRLGGQRLSEMSK